MEQGLAKYHSNQAILTLDFRASKLSAFMWLFALRGRVMWHIPFLAVVWDLWKEGNFRRFEGSSSLIDSMLEKLQFFTSSWTFGLIYLWQPSWEFGMMQHLPRCSSLVAFLDGALLLWVSSRTLRGKPFSLSLHWLDFSW